jgi:hypothetical protein
VLTHGEILLGAFDSEENAIAFLRPLVSRDSAVEDLANRWVEARRAFLSAPDAGDAPLLAPEPQVRSVAEQRLDTSFYRESLADKCWSIADVRLDSLVVFQPMVVRERVEVWASRCAGDLVDCLYPLSAQVDVGVRTADGPEVTLVSSQGDLVVSGARVRRDEGAVEIVVRIQPRPNYATALHVGERLVLRNGYHRLCAAWRAGVRTAPLVVIQGNFDGLSARMRAGFSVALLAAVRPPRLSDLAGGGSGTITVELRPRRYEITVRAARCVVYEDDSQPL